MGGLFVYTLYAGYLGWQWRRVRTIQDEINELKKQEKPVPVTPEGTPLQSTTPSPLQVKIQQLSEVCSSNCLQSIHVITLFALNSLQIKSHRKGRNWSRDNIKKNISTQARSCLRLVCLNPLAAESTPISGPESYSRGPIYTPVQVTCWLIDWYLRNNKHRKNHKMILLILGVFGTAITVLWAAAAALVPPMQKGSETARNLHIALNVLNVLLFISQIPTGWDIVLKVFEFTKWPWSYFILSYFNHQI